MRRRRSSNQKWPGSPRARRSKAVRSKVSGYAVRRVIVSQPAVRRDILRPSPGSHRSMRIAILQSSYIPWKGYFDLIRSVDEFVLFDDVQYTRRDWRNRNRIKTPHGPRWLSIAVNTKGRYLEPIKDITVSEPGWNTQHWDTLTLHYGKAKFFGEYKELLSSVYRDSTDPHLSAINRRFIEAICGVLGIRTKLSWSMQYELVTGRTERIVSICRQAGATEYISGPSARAYLDEAAFEGAG